MSTTFQVVKSDWVSCPFQQWHAHQFNVLNGTIVSVGFQNEGMATLLQTTQMFVMGPNSGYIQVVNRALTATNFRLIVVVATESATELLSVEMSNVKTGTIEAN